MNNYKHRTLAKLPRVFESAPGLVDVNLITDIIKPITQSPSGAIKCLLQRVNKSHHLVKNTFDALSLEIPSPTFRAKWYVMWTEGVKPTNRNSMRDKNRSQSFPAPLYDLVNKWLKNKGELSNLTLPSIEDFFEKKNGQISRRLDRIEVLSEYLTALATHSTADAALFAWSVLEEADWLSFSRPDDESLTRLRGVLLADLDRRSENALLELLHDGEFSESGRTPNLQQMVAPASGYSPVKPVAIQTRGIVELPAEPDSVKNLNAFCANKIIDLNELMRNLTDQHKLTVDKVSHLLDSVDSGNNFDEAIEAITSVREMIEGVKSRAIAIERQIDLDLAASIRALSVKFCSIHAPTFSVSAYEQWRGAVIARQASAIEVLKAADALTQFDADLIHEISLRRQKITVDLEDAVLYVQSITKEAILRSRGLVERQNILEILKAREQDFSWNPILDSNIPDETWTHLGEYLSTDASMPQVLGLCVRKHYDELKDRTAKLIDDHAIRTEIPLEDAFHILSYMTIGQIDGMRCKTEGGNAIVATFLFKSFLRRVDTSPTDAFAFLSADPLRSLLNEQNSTGAGRFFEAANRVSTRESDIPLRVKDLHRLVNLSTSSISIDDNATSERLRLQLVDLLVSHRGGGATYAELRDLAYREICQPLKDSADRGHLDDAAQLYRSFKEGFVFGDHLHTWRTVIPGNRKKETDYIHQLRLWVRDKLADLDKWLDEFESTTLSGMHRGGDEDVRLLETAISEVLLDNDPACRVLQRWFETLSKSPKNRPSDQIPLSHGLAPDFELFLRSESADPLRPRTFLAAMNGRVATTADLLADELFVSFGLYEPTTLAVCYADQKRYEAFTELRAAVTDEFPLDIVRQVEAGVDYLESQYLCRIQNINSRIDDLDRDNAEIITDLLSSIEGLLNRQRWTKVASELKGVEETLAEIILEETDSQVTRSLLAEITKLGGHAPAENSRLNVELEYSRVMAETAPRRKHLDFLKTLLDALKLDVVEGILAEEILNELKRPERLPDADRSDEVNLVFESTVSALIEPLRHSHFYPPNHKRLLHELGLAVLSSLRLYGVMGDSHAVLLLLDSERAWTRVANGEVAILELLKLYPAREYDANVEPVLVTADRGLNISSNVEVIGVRNDEGPQEDAVVFAAYVDRLAESLSRIVSSAQVKNKTGRDNFDAATSDLTRLETAILCHRRFKNSDSPRSATALGHLTDCAVAILKEEEELLTTEEHATVLHLINGHQGTDSVRALIQPKGNKGKGSSPLNDFVSRFLSRLAKDCEIEVSHNPIEQIQNLSLDIDKLRTRKDLVRLSLSPVGKNEPLLMKNIWDSYSGEGKQAEARASLMNILWQSSATSALACCFRYSPIDIDSRTANALSGIAEQALSNGKGELLQSFVDLKRTTVGKPFQIFVDLLLAKMPNNEDLPAKIDLVKPLERTITKNILVGVLRINPRKRESPSSITLKLPKISPLEFHPGNLKLELTGPFIKGEEFLSTNFLLHEMSASNFTIPVECEAISITGITSYFTARLDFEIPGNDSFEKLTSKEISEAFDDFPAGPMTGYNYVSRPAAEKKILDCLILSKTVRSIWITSPRRSGKSTMLFWILDEYSQKAKRDNLVVYFSCISRFANTGEFNKFVWDGVVEHPDNESIQSIIPNMRTLKKSFSQDVDAGVFLEKISNYILNVTKANRIIYLFDEIDKLATMHFLGDPYREVASQIVWSLRQMMQRRGDIGFVFAGSSAAKKIFLTNSDAPFFNSGVGYELPPFSSGTVEEEALSRSLVEPPRIKGKFTVPKEALNYILWICSGIPYYIKLLSAATFAVTKQSYILKSDVNEGLNSLLNMTTGLSGLSGDGGAPGSDELRTIALEKGSNRTIMLAVLYALAEMESPVSGHPIRRARLYGGSSPLVIRYGIPRQDIERGLDMAIELGLFSVSTDVPPQITFSMPILGESIRCSIGARWAEISHELERLTTDL